MIQKRYSIVTNILVSSSFILIGLHFIYAEPVDDIPMTTPNDKCVQVVPKNISNIALLVGSYYGIEKSADGSKLCKNVTYTLTGPNHVHIKHYLFGNGTWHPGGGYGVMLAPGVFNIDLKDRPDQNGIHIIIGSDGENYVVIYACLNNTPSIGIQTVSLDPPDFVWERAYIDIAANNLTLADVTAPANLC